MKYAEYLQTPAWKQKRIEKFQQVGYNCQLCNSDKKLQVHHKTYKNLRHEPLNDLTVLCAECHSLFHNKLASNSDIVDDGGNYIDDAKLFARKKNINLNRSFISAEIIGLLKNSKQKDIAERVINRYFESLEKSGVRSEF